MMKLAYSVSGCEPYNVTTRPLTGCLHSITHRPVILLTNRSSLIQNSTTPFSVTPLAFNIPSSYNTVEILIMITIITHYYN